jgi:Flp pilus assembly protein TadG
LIEVRILLRFIRNQDGSVLVEVAVMIPIVFVFLLGSVDFLNAMRQWNSATKAVEVGARLAAVSDPVATGLNSIPTSAVNPPTVNLGDPMPDFEVTCDGATSACTCTRGSCTGMGSYSATAMNTIVFGRGKTACGASANGYYNAGMCNFLSGITDANVKVVYSQTGLGYAGRTAGPVPTITVSVENVPFQFFFLKGLMGFANRSIPGLATTITGEALSSAAAQ